MKKDSNLYADLNEKLLKKILIKNLIEYKEEFRIIKENQDNNTENK